MPPCPCRVRHRADARSVDQGGCATLAIDENFEIRKIKRFFFEPSEFEFTPSEAAAFERRSYAWGAVDANEVNERRGNYLDAYWRTRTQADVTVRLEYRQMGLGNMVSAQELYYPEARGSYRSKFRITGDEFLEFGKVSAWRILLIVDGKIVAFRQSFIWR